MRVPLITLTLLAYAVLYPATAADGAEWKVFLNSTYHAGPIVSRTVTDGQRFHLRADDCSGVPAASRTLVEALDGISFYLGEKPFDGDAVYHVILHNSGNAFTVVNSVQPFLNITLEAYENGTKRDMLSLSSGNTIEIRWDKTAAMESLLQRCGLRWSDNLICVYSIGGDFNKSGIRTEKTASTLQISADRFARVLGGLDDDLGFPSGATVDTWKKIKLLFR